MIPSPPKSRFATGTSVRVIQHVRIGHRRWTTELTGIVEAEGFRPVGGMEMGGKAMYSRQETLRLRKSDGEITLVALDENTEVKPL